jgi:hypothetical protein
MSFKTSFASALIALTVACTMAMPAYAQQSAAVAKSTVVEHAAKGSVVTLTDKSMVVRVKKDKDLNVAITPNTEKIGEISSGKYVTVHYRNEKGQHVATSIQQSAPETSAFLKPKGNSPTER